MKGNKKTIYKSLVFVVAIITALLCVGISLQPKKSAFAVNVNYDNEEFSAIDENGLILSVEKVGVMSTTDKSIADGYEMISDDAFKQKLYKTDILEEDNLYSSMLIQNNEKYYYNPYVESTNFKYVVKKGSFVMLNNQVDNDGYYYSQSLGGYDESKSPVKMAEAIMLSFGQYYYDNSGAVAIAGTDTGAGIQTVNVEARLNGQLLKLPSPRNYLNNNYEDFVCIIPQAKGYEGYYEFTFTYFYGDVTYTQTFDFYIIYNSSYNATYQSNNNNTYSTLPTFENVGIVNGTHQYSIGEYRQGLNYPTLTYDYTKYKLSYKLTANGKVTSYDYTFKTMSTLGQTYGTLVQTVTSFGASKTTTTNLNYYQTGALNFVNIVFTEMGNYEFTFEYLYAGYNSANMPEMNLTIPKQALTINGFELKYSKAGYDEAQLRYLTISSNSADKVDLIIPNGYKLGTTPSDTALGVVYSLDDSSLSRVGRVIASEDASIHNKIEGVKSQLSGIGDKYVFDYIIDGIISSSGKYGLNLNDESYRTNLNTFLSYIKNNDFYIKTNQGSLWLTGNDKFADDSFYYYSNQPFSVVGNSDSGYSLSEKTWENYTNTTTFTRTGYYLVFINVDTDGNGSGDYYQIFAFQYTTDTINISVNEYEENEYGDITLLKPIGSGQYTNKNVQISWVEPKTFERQITANYYSVKNAYLTKTELLKYAPKPLTNLGKLGSEINAGEGATYLIELKSEGMSASYLIFTIDRTPITGVGAYAVDKMSTANNGIGYKFKVLNGDYVQLTNSITSSLATLFWQDKLSGANIIATYTYTPFIKNSETKPNEVYLSSGASWYSTNYELGTTIGSFDITKVRHLGNEVTFTNVLYRQGLYVFTLTDEAGNSVKYMFVIDNTEAFFKVSSGEENQFVTASSLLFSDTVNVEVGTHKVIDLKLNNGENNVDEDVSDLIIKLADKASKAEFENLGYYVQVDTNINALKSLFAKTGSNYYLTVKNNSLASRNSENLTDSITSIASISINNRARDIQYVEDGSTSTIRKLYLMSENNRYSLSDVTNSNSYVVIEINVDNSRGTVLYSNNTFGVNVIDNAGNINSSSSVYRLNTGSDVLTDDKITTIGIDKAHATSDNYLAFTWNTGAGKYEVESVTYDYYSLNLNEDNYNKNWSSTTNIYYYNYIKTITLYSSATAQNGATVSENRGFALLNVENSKTLEGLYVIKRTYKNTSEDLGSDNLVQNYYAIVDRYGIIDQYEEHVGSYIKLGLKEDETDFNTFNTINAQTEYFSYSIDSQTIYSNKPYSLYLTSDKLPITLNIPIAKFFGGDGNTGSTYYAGRLTFEFYFRDLQSQLTGEYKDNVIKLFEISSNDFDKNNNYSNGIYTIDLRTYLTNAKISPDVIERLSRSVNDSDWLCLPGDYIVVIKDTVRSSANAGDVGAHEKVIGFRIERGEVSADIYSVPNRDMTVEDSQNVAVRQAENNYRLVTSEEFVKIDMQEYIKNALQAGLDLNYLIVEQTRNGYTTNYINHQYANINGKYKLDDSNKSIVVNYYDESSNLKNRTIYLDTFLRDNDGNIITENLSQTLTYNITIRFRLADTSNSDSDKYINCYYYYDTANNNSDTYNPNTYYEAHISVIIDRIAPSDNINNLVENDKLVGYYVQDNGEDMFESSFIKTNSNVYFVNQYKTYYGTGDTSKIYAFRVEDGTKFINTEVYGLYIRTVDPATINLSLPAITNLSRYTKIENNDVHSFGEFLSGSTVGYYEILELDEAGNTTQYVVFYDPAGSTSTNDDIELNINFTEIKDGSIYNKDETLSKSCNGNTYTIFDVGLSSEEVERDFTDNFYRISLTDTNNPSNSHYILTNFNTSFTANGLMNDIASLIKNAGEGNYILKVESRTDSFYVILNYYNYNEIIELNVEKLVENVGGNYQINLQGANVKDGAIMYYASKIEIIHNGETYVYTCRPSEGQYNYYDQSNNIVNVLTNLSGTYQIKMTDAFGNVSSYRFNTSGEPFYSISFGENENANYYEYSNVYYAFQQVNIKFDNSIFKLRVSRTVGASTQSMIFSANESWSYLSVMVAKLNESGNVLCLYPYFETNSKQGENISYKIDFILLADDSVEYSYNVVLDSKIGEVNLTANNISQSMTIDVNADYKTTISEYYTSGTSNLVWNKTSHDVLNYAYTLYELKLSGEYVSCDLNAQTSYVISTASDSEGIYKFVIDILSPTGQVLGNKIYTFKVLKNSSELYYVTMADNSVAKINSSFNFSEINDYLTVTRLQNLGLNSTDDLPKTNIDLYVYNEQLNIQTATDKGVELKSTEIGFGEKYLFTIYRAYTSTYSLYFGVLKVGIDTSFVHTVELITNTSSELLSIQTKFAFTYLKNKTDSISLQVSPKISGQVNENTAITQKNSLVLDIYLNDEFVKTVDLNNKDKAGSVKLLGSGKYTIVFKDLAGNVNTFVSNLGSQQSSLDITILKETSITVNGMAPIDSAYYNGNVVVSVYNPALYELASVSLTATRNGKAYTPIKSQYNYTFMEYGTYRVVVSAKYLGVDLSKVVVFTIVNPFEARESIDLTSLGGYNIVSVYNGDKDITNAFIENIFSQNAGGRLINYNELLNYQKELNITAGKQVFTINYEVDDGVYPIRQVGFTFTMNNEMPNIECSLSSGESTTKGFTISFNPGIIYEQVGEALIYINDSLIYSINENSPLRVLSLEITEKQYGAGDYYVRLETASGQVISSFKAVIKEPLNTWAIVIIVVVSVIVIGVIVTIIVLRRKMRIR